MKRQSIRQHEKRLEEMMAEYENELANAKSARKEIISKAKDEAQKMLSESNRIIENTIRHIKESQAEKEKTKEARQQLEDFKGIVHDEITSVITPSEQKVAVLNSKVKKIKKEKEPEQEIPVPMEKNLPLKPGDAVRMIDTLAAGEIISIKGQKAEVETGSLRFKVSLDKIERISRAELKKSLRSNMPVRENDPGLIQRNITFSPEIDIRGERGEEAINKVRELIDNALIVRHRHLRILHGKGNGILRQLVRDYLATTGVVKSFRDEHVEFGGSGITVVEMDL
jgi:DNA mismatch repair protein MutS2